MDRYFISGVNHVVYHGTAYSPQDEQWPGWLFYAAVHFNERNPFWDHFGAFNQYVARVQSFLQSGSADNDVLLYFPIYDQWADQSIPGMLRHFDGGLDSGFDGSAFKQGAEQMLAKGYSFDFISDSQLLEFQENEKKLQREDATYKTVVVPQSRYIPVSTFKKLVNLAQEGATIIAYQGLPEGVPGLGNLKERRTHFKELVNNLNFNDTGEQHIQEAKVGEGRFLRGNDLDLLLNYAGIRLEAMVDKGLRFTRRKHASGHTYFITNWGDKNIDGWVPLARNVESAAIFDPMYVQTGYADVRSDSEDTSEIYLQLAPGESCIVQTDDSENSKPTYRYVKQAGNANVLTGSWTLNFIEDGSELPVTVKTDTLKSWTGFKGETVKSFSGTGVYTIRFDRPKTEAEVWKLDLGKVRESATVSINGQKIGTSIGPSYQLVIDDTLLKDKNMLKVEVSNLMANRIAWLERKNVNWKKFYNVNFPARRAENRNKRGLFDASGWEPKVSGLLGPVQIIPLRILK